MSKKINIIFEGLINNYEAVQKFQDLLMAHGSKILQVVDTLDTADMKVNISEINGHTNLLEEAIYTINTAKAIGKYEKKRKRVFKTIAQKTLLASTRKNIN